MKLFRTNIWSEARGFGKLGYYTRLGAYSFSVILIFIHYFDNGFKLTALEYFTAIIFFLVPQVLLAHYVSSGNNKRVAIQHGVIDVFFAGWVVGSINLEPITSYMFLLAAITNYIADRGLKKLHKLFLFPLGALTVLLLKNFQVPQTSGHLTFYLTLAYGLVHFSLLCYNAYLSVKHYNKSKTEAMEHNEQIGNQKDEILAQSDKLKNLNELLMQLNNSLEQKVSERTKSLEQKNNKLAQYAYTNTYKLDAPTQDILETVNIFINEETNDERKQILLNRIKEKVQELDEIIRDISIDLELEDYFIK